MSSGTLPQAGRILEIIDEHSLDNKQTQQVIEYLPALSRSIKQGMNMPVSRFRRMVGIDPPIQFLKEMIEVDYRLPRHEMARRVGLRGPSLGGKGRFGETVVFEVAIFEFANQDDYSAHYFARGISEEDPLRPWAPAQVEELICFNRIFRSLHTRDKPVFAIGVGYAGTGQDFYPYLSDIVDDGIGYAPSTDIGSKGQVFLAIRRKV